MAKKETKKIRKVEGKKLQKIEALEADSKYATHQSRITQNESHFLTRIPKNIRETLDIEAGNYMVFKLDQTKEKPTLEDLQIYISREKPEKNKEAKTIVDEVVD